MHIDMFWVECLQTFASLLRTQMTSKSVYSILYGVVSYRAAFVRHEDLTRVSKRWDVVISSPYYTISTYRHHTQFYTHAPYAVRVYIIVDVSPIKYDIWNMYEGLVLWYGRHLINCSAAESLYPRPRPRGNLFAFDPNDTNICLFYSFYLSNRR